MPSVWPLASRISLDRALKPLPSFDAAEHKDTVYICVVDRDRNVGSFINWLFFAYGSGLMSPRSGVLFHNRGQSFSLKAGHPNEIGPSKRPMHKIIPGMAAQDGRVSMTFGVMGGHYQAMGHAHLLARIFDSDFDLQTAIDQPRLFPLPGTSVVEAEEAYRVRLGPELERRGFTVQSPRTLWGRTGHPDRLGAWRIDPLPAKVLSGHQRDHAMRKRGRSHAEVYSWHKL